MGYQRRVHGECLLAGSAGYTHSSIMGENPEIWKAAAMADHFDKIQKLTEKIDGVPNFRRVPGYKVYCCGQPTIAGFGAAINKACGETYPKTNKIIWLNMRQEPIVYVNGNPICARPPNKIGEYAELGNVTRDSVKKDEEEFMRVVEGRAKGNDGKLKYVDVNKAEHEVEVKELTTLSLVIEGLKEKFPGLVHQRIPVCNSAAPTEADFDTLCKIHHRLRGCLPLQRVPACRLLRGTRRDRQFVGHTYYRTLKKISGSTLRR